ncbi:MAG: succinate dehydrogenase, hydrophobic membrane anchor protein [Alphaproteobacteria bacterium]
MSKATPSFRHPLAKARGLGSAKSGTQHWWHQRVTAMALVPLSIWLVFTLIHLVGADYATAKALIAQPHNSILLGLFLLVGFSHAHLGGQVIIEDYVHCEKLKIIKLVLFKMACFAAAFASLFAVLKIAIAG